MKTDITPSDSVCPIFLEPTDPAQIAADKAEAPTPKPDGDYYWDEDSLSWLAFTL